MRTWIYLSRVRICGSSNNTRAGRHPLTAESLAMFAAPWLVLVIYCAVVWWFSPSGVSASQFFAAATRQDMRRPFGSWCSARRLPGSSPNRSITRPAWVRLLVSRAVSDTRSIICLSPWPLSQSILSAPEASIWRCPVSWCPNMARFAPGCFLSPSVLGCSTRSGPTPRCRRPISVPKAVSNIGARLV